MGRILAFTSGLHDWKELLADDPSKQQNTAFRHDFVPFLRRFR